VGGTRNKKTGIVLPNCSMPIASQHLKREIHIHEGCQSIHRLGMYVQMPVATVDSYKATLSLLQVLPVYLSPDLKLLPLGLSRSLTPQQEVFICHVCFKE